MGGRGRIMGGRGRCKMRVREVDVGRSVVPNGLGNSTGGALPEVGCLVNDFNQVAINKSLSNIDGGFVVGPKTKMNKDLAEGVRRVARLNDVNTLNGRLADDIFESGLNSFPMYIVKGARNADGRLRDEE